jgi:hypothetical protein
VICTSDHCRRHPRAGGCLIPLYRDLVDVMAAIMHWRFNCRSITDICAIGGIKLDDFTSGLASKEIFGLGRQ